MRKRGVLLAVLIVLALAQACQAADLQAGWYVKLGGVALYGFDGMYERGGDWHFEGGLGTFGPFEVTEPGVGWADRLVSVPTSAMGVPAGTTVYLLGEPETEVDFPVSNLLLAYETDYDATQMRVELFVHCAGGDYELLWSQNQSGYAMAIPDVLAGSGRLILPGDSIVFRVTTVPEPSQVLALGLPAALLIGLARRRMKS